MTFQEMVNAVVVETNRPDMDSSQGGDGTIQQAVAKATSYLHGIDFFVRDIKSVTIQFDQPAFVQILDSTILPRYRSLSWARKNDPSLATFQQNPTILPPLYNKNLAVNPVQSMAMFKKIDIDNIFDDEGYNSEKLDVMYQAGDSIYFKSSSAFQSMLFGFYQYPNVDTANNGENFSSWIARDFGYAIVTVASSNVFDASGKSDAAKKYNSPDGAIATWTRNILISNIELQGR